MKAENCIFWLAMFIAACIYINITLSDENEFFNVQIKNSPNLDLVISSISIDTTAMNSKSLNFNDPKLQGDLEGDGVINMEDLNSIKIN